MATRAITGRQPDTGRWLVQGAIGGVIAGLIFALFEMVMATVLMGAEAFFMPLRMIGAIALGAGALEPSYSLATAAIAGLVVHMILSPIFGVVFALLASLAPAARRMPGALIAAAGVYGLLLWIVNFFVIAPLAGWVWFPNGTNAVVQIIAHAAFFGAVLGLYLTRAAAPRPALQTAS